jgi:hypothetical protein
VVRCSDQEAVGLILLEELQERVQYAANLANVILPASLATERIYLVEKVDPPRGDDCVEDQAQLGRRLAHELRDQTVKADNEEW